MIEKIFEQLAQQGILGLFAAAVLYLLDKHMKSQLDIFKERIDAVVKDVFENRDILKNMHNENMRAHSEQKIEHTAIKEKIDSLKK